MIPQIKRIEGVGDVMELGDTYLSLIHISVKDYYDKNHIAYDPNLFCEGDCEHCHE